MLNNERIIWFQKEKLNTQKVQKRNVLPRRWFSQECRFSSCFWCRYCFSNICSQYYLASYLWLYILVDVWIWHVSRVCCLFLIDSWFERRAVYLTYQFQTRIAGLYSFPGLYFPTQRFAQIEQGVTLVCMDFPGSLNTYTGANSVFCFVCKIRRWCKKQLSRCNQIIYKYTLGCPNSSLHSGNIPYLVCNKYDVCFSICLKRTLLCNWRKRIRKGVWRWRV